MATERSAPEATIQDRVTKLVKELGIPAALLVYYVVKDWMFTEKITALMTKLDVALTLLQK
jgi:hypothetical protein